MFGNDIKLRRPGYSTEVMDIESSEPVSSNNSRTSYSYNSVTGNDTFKAPESPDTRKRWVSWFRVSMLVVVWYVFAVAAITSSKKVMLIHPLPFLLCCTQFAIASIITRVYLSWNNMLKHMQASFESYIQQISVSYTFGFIFTNISFSLVNANFAETIKAAEPISTVVLGKLILREESSLITYLTLIPICSGVAISCFHDDSFHFYGFIFAMLSNFCFSTRAVVAKKLNIHHAGAMDEVSMFYHISRIGLVILIPAMIFFEGKIVWGLVNEYKWENAFALCLVILNGVAYTIYNVSSFLVLTRTNLITHAVLNCFRRVFIILFTAYYFEVNMSLINLAGVFIAVAGVLSFAYSRTK